MNEDLKKEAREDFETRMLPLHEHTTQTAIDKADALVLLEKWINRAYELGKKEMLGAAEEAHNKYYEATKLERARCAEIARAHDPDAGKDMVTVQMIIAAAIEKEMEGKP